MLALCCRARLAATQQGQALINAQMAQQRQQCNEEVELLQVRTARWLDVHCCTHIAVPTMP
jgi:hypothetical protein